MLDPVFISCIWCVSVPYLVPIQKYNRKNATMLQNSRYKLTVYTIDPFHIVISLSDRSSIEKSIKPFLKMKGQIAY